MSINFYDFFVRLEEEQKRKLEEERKRKLEEERKRRESLQQLETLLTYGTLLNILQNEKTQKEKEDVVSDESICHSILASIQDETLQKNFPNTPQVVDFVLQYIKESTSDISLETMNSLCFHSGEYRKKFIEKNAINILLEIISKNTKAETVTFALLCIENILGSENINDFVALSIQRTLPLVYNRIPEAANQDDKLIFWKLKFCIVHNIGLLGYHKPSNDECISLVRLFMKQNTGVLGNVGFIIKPHDVVRLFKIPSGDIFRFLAYYVISVCGLSPDPNWNEVFIYFNKNVLYDWENINYGPLMKSAAEKLQNLKSGFVASLKNVYDSNKGFSQKDTYQNKQPVHRPTDRPYVIEEPPFVPQFSPTPQKQPQPFPASQKQPQPSPTPQKQPQTPQTKPSSIPQESEPKQPPQSPRRNLSSPIPQETKPQTKPSPIQQEPKPAQTPQRKPSSPIPEPEPKPAQTPQRKPSSPIPQETKPTPIQQEPKPAQTPQRKPSSPIPQETKPQTKPSPIQQEPEPKPAQTPQRKPSSPIPQEPEPKPVTSPRSEPRSPRTQPLPKTRGNADKEESENILKSIPVINFKEAFTDRRIIDEGGFGLVWSAIWRNNPVAVKQFRNSLETQGPKAVIKISQELNIISQMRHQRTLTLLYHCRDNDNIYLVTQFYKRKSLFHLLYQEKLFLKKDTFCILVKDICGGLVYLHNYDPKILHLDLKPKNLLIDGIIEPRVVIADFGISVMKRTSQQSSNYSPCGTYNYMAPEIGKLTTEKSDIYSLGIIMWEMIHREIPHSNVQPPSEILDFVRQGTRPKWKESLHLPQQLKELIERCWADDINSRPTANEVLKQIDIIYATESISFECSQ